MSATLRALQPTLDETCQRRGEEGGSVRGAVCGAVLLWL